ncbi:MAG: MoaD/ThiS family protein [Methanobacterium sp.]|jgi:sulfur carrier protein|nr:MoaD/ThiS family protein [Methanobacterium sp.]
MDIEVIIGEDTLEKSIPENSSIKELLKLLEIPTETVVVKRNQSIVIEEEIINDGDTIEIIKVIYGG